MAGRSGGTPSAPGSAGWNTFDKRPGAAAGSNRDGGAPSLIRCAICKKPKSRDEFSNRQLLKFTAYNKGGRTIKKDVGSVHATCSQCTANQTVELKCYVCDKVKGLNLFAKNQRKDPDNARCIKCVDSDITAEAELLPDDAGDVDEESNDEDNEAEIEWDRGTSGSTANNINPYRPQNKATAWSSAAGEDDEDEFEDVSSSATSTHGGSSRHQGYQLPARPSAAQRAPAVFSSRANQPSNTYAGRAPPVEDDDDEWETMDKNRSAGGSSRASSTASPSGYSSQQPARRKNGWGKASKADGMPEDNPWANYNRK